MSDRIFLDAIGTARSTFKVAGNEVLDAADLTTTVGTPGSDSLVPTEKAVRTAIASVSSPVVSVNGETGAVVLDAADVGADIAGAASAVQGNLTTHIGDTANPHATTYTQVGAEQAGSVAAHAALTTGVHGLGAASQLAVVTVIGEPAADTNVPTEKAVADAFLTGRYVRVNPDVGTASGARGRKDKAFQTVAQANAVRQSGDRLVLDAGTNNISAPINITNGWRIDMMGGCSLNVVSGINAFTYAGGSIRIMGNGFIGGAGTLLTGSNGFGYIQCMSFADAPEAGRYFVDVSGGLLTLKAFGGIFGSGAGGLIRSSATTEIVSGQINTAAISLVPSFVLTGFGTMKCAALFHDSTTAPAVQIGGGFYGMIDCGANLNLSSKRAIELAANFTGAAEIKTARLYNSGSEPAISTVAGGTGSAVLRVLTSTGVTAPILDSAGSNIIIDGGAHAALAAIAYAVRSSGGSLKTTSTAEISGAVRSLQITGGSGHVLSGKISGGSTASLDIGTTPIYADGLRVVGIITGSGAGTILCVQPCTGTVAPTGIPFPGGHTFAIIPGMT